MEYVRQLGDAADQVHCNENGCSKSKRNIACICLVRLIASRAADPFKTGMGTYATSVPQPTFSSFTLSCRLMRVLYEHSSAKGNKGELDCPDTALNRQDSGVYVAGYLWP
jgi:hypothetical protein